MNLNTIQKLVTFKESLKLVTIKLGTFKESLKLVTIKLGTFNESLIRWFFSLLAHVHIYRFFIFTQDDLLNVYSGYGMIVFELIFIGVAIHFLLDYLQNDKDEENKTEENKTEENKTEENIINEDIKKNLISKIEYIIFKKINIIYIKNEFINR